ncbi:hypothetical protein [Larkinella terrae]|uniref:Bulb-type lectin domain-containing protein n=1 Tax=Larkinella terrae TaxID=2025311 RepID=A0A7K0EKY2_9BACT|nr:hypothetical protein [Larkinella terrae]MRS62513.1 hypothetical protein [Larkinella terrae]
MKKTIFFTLILAIGVNITLFAQRSRINQGQGVQVGQQLHSQNGNYVLRMQEDRNLCFYSDAQKGPQGMKHIWCANEKNLTGEILQLQKDGNLALYDKQGGHLWSTDTYRGTEAQKGHHLVIENSGMMVLYNSSDKPIWNNKEGRLY